MKTLAITLILILSQTAFAHNEFDPLDYQIKPQNYKYDDSNLPVRSKAVDDILDNPDKYFSPPIEWKLDMNTTVSPPNIYQESGWERENDILNRCAYTTAFGCGKR